MNRILKSLGITLICSISLVCCGVDHYKTEMIEAKVSKKYFQSFYITYIPVSVDKTITMQPVYHQEEYNVSIDADGITRTFDNREFFQSTKEGAKIKVIKKTGYDEQGNPISQKIELP